MAQGIQILLARPGVISDSCIIHGILLDLAASTTGTATKPPFENTTSGLIFPRICLAWARPFITLNGSLRFLISIYLRNLPLEIP